MRKFKKDILGTTDVVITTTTTTTIPPTTTTSTTTSTTSTTTTTTVPPTTTTTTTTTTLPVTYYKLDSCNILYGQLFTSIPPSIANQQYIDTVTNVRYYWDNTTTITPGMVGANLQKVSGYTNCTVPPPTTTTTTLPPMKLEVRLCGGTTTYYITVTNQGLNVGSVLKLQKSGTPFNGTDCWEIIDNATTQVIDYNLVSVLTVSIDCASCATSVPTTTTTSTTTTTTCSPTTYYELSQCYGTGYAFTKLAPNLGIGQRYVLPSTTVYYTYTGNSVTQCDNPPTLNESIQKTSFTGCPTTTTSTTTTTTSPVNFTFSSVCTGTTATITADAFTGGSGEYEMSSVLYTSEVNAYTGIFITASQPTNFYGVSNGTWWFAVRDKNNPSNVIAKSVTFSCTTTTTTTTQSFDYYLATQYSCSDCGTALATNVLVRFPAGTSIVVNRFYLENTYSNYVYQITDINQPAGVATLLKTPAYTTCSGACTANTTTTTTTTTGGPTTTSTTTTLGPLSLTVSNSCPGTCNGTGQIVITASGGTGVYQYSIDGGATYGSSNTFSSLYNGTYYVYVKDSANTTANTTTVISSCVSTDPVWTNTGSTYCVSGSCTLKQLQTQTNTCCTSPVSGTTRVIDTGTVSSTCGTWTLVYYCSGYNKYSKEVNFCTSEERNITLVETNSTFCGYYTPLPSFSISTSVGSSSIACTRTLSGIAYCLGGDPTIGTVVRTTDNPSSTPLGAGFYHINVTGDEYIQLNSSGVVIDRGSC